MPLACCPSDEQEAAVTIIDARPLEDGARLEADVCIVAAGAAGVTLALELEAPTRRVVLVESGGFEPDEAVQSVYDLESVGYPPRPDYMARACYFGASCNLWAGRCIALQELDFGGPAWSRTAPWPIPSAEIRRH
jgi:choline dehydrogenase-like flavoprotein